MNASNKKVTVVTVVYGKRWPLLKQVIESLIGDQKVKTFIIVDNGCHDKDAMDVYARQYAHKIVVLRQEKNIGFSGAVSKGLYYARDTECDYVLVLDDDSVPEEGAIDMFLDNYKYFPNNKVVLCGNRIDVPGTENVFKRKTISQQMPTGTIFEVFSLRKVINLCKLILGMRERANGSWMPIVPTQGFVTGGSFIPIEAVRAVAPPEENFFIYGEDLDYSWRIKKAGYMSFQCSKPIIHDIDMTFSKEGDHIWGLFKKDTPDYKVYYRMRNSVIISRRHTYQSKFSLLLNVIVWYIGLFILGLFKHSDWNTYFHRVKVIIRAVLDGYKYPNTTIPKHIKIPQ